MKGLVVFFFVLAVCIASIGAKLQQPDRVRYLDLAPHYVAVAHARFEEAGFLMVQSDYENTVGVVSPECMAWVATSQAEGDHDAAFRKFFGAESEIVMLFQGHEYFSRPNFKIQFAQMRSRFFGVFRNEPKVGPIWALAIGNGCDAVVRQKMIGILKGIDA